MDKLKRRGILFVLSSPSGAGKTSIARYILDKDKNISGLSFEGEGCAISLASA